MQNMFLPCNPELSWVIGSPSHYSLQFICFHGLGVGTLENIQSSIQSCVQILIPTPLDYKAETLAIAPRRYCFSLTYQYSIT